MSYVNVKTDSTEVDLLPTSFDISKVGLGIHDERWRSFRQMGLSEGSQKVLILRLL